MQVWLSSWGVGCLGWHGHWGNAHTARALEEKSYWSRGSTINGCLFFCMAASDGQLYGILPDGSENTYKEHERLKGVVAGGESRRKGMSGLDGVGWETKGPLWIWIRAGINVRERGAQGTDLYRIKCHCFQVSEVTPYIFCFPGNWSESIGGWWL